MSNTPTGKDGSLHSGHRMRMKDSFLKDKGASLPDHKILEMLLFYSIPRKDTNDLAHKLIAEFGSLSEVIYAPTDRLLAFPEIGINTAVHFALMRETFKRMRQEKYSSRTKFDTLSMVGELIVNHFKGDREEHVCALLFDSEMHLIEIAALSHGSVTGAAIDVRSLARLAITKNAAKVIIAHNHPGGTTEPSLPDRVITNSIDAALNTVGVTLVEHIVANDVGYTPMLQAKSLYFIQRNKASPEADFYKHFYSN